MSFDLLPEWILEEIFKYLTVQERIAVQRVCKHWLQLSRESLRRLKSVCFVGDVRKLWPQVADCDEDLMAYIKCTENVIRLPNSFEDAMINVLKQVGKNLNNCSVCKSERQEWNNLGCIRLLHGLEVTFKRNVPNTQCKVHEVECVEFIAIDFSDNFDAWNASTCFYLAKKLVFRAMATNCKKIFDLLKDLSYLEELVFVTYGQLTPCLAECFASLINENIFLKRLTIGDDQENYDLSELKSPLTDFSVQSTLHNSPVFSDTILNSLLNNSTHTLQKLCLDALVLSDQFAKIHQFINLKDLRFEVDFAEWPEFDFNNLETLCLRFCENYFNEGMVSFITRHKKLKVLCLEMLDDMFARKSNQVLAEESQFLQEVAFTCRSLEYIKLTGGFNATDDLLPLFTEMEKLKYCVISSPKWTDEALSKFIQSSKSLQALDLSFAVKKWLNFAASFTAFVNRAMQNQSISFFLNYKNNVDFVCPRNLRVFGPEIGSKDEHEWRYYFNGDMLNSCHDLYAWNRLKL